MAQALAAFLGGLHEHDLQAVAAVSSGAGVAVYQVRELHFACREAPVSIHGNWLGGRETRDT